MKFIIKRLANLVVTYPVYAAFECLQTWIDIIHRSDTLTLCNRSTRLALKMHFLIGRRYL